MTLYREKVHAAPWLYVGSALVIPASILIFLPINILGGIIVALALYGMCVLGLIAASPVIEVTDTDLVAGRARIDLAHVGEARAYREPEATLQRGQKLDARAWMVIRGWVSDVVTVDITDENDPAPYWIVSTRRPDELVAAIASARDARTTAHGDED